MKNCPVCLLMIAAEGLLNACHCVCVCVCVSLMWNCIFVKRWKEFGKNKRNLAFLLTLHTELTGWEPPALPFHLPSSLENLTVKICKRKAFSDNYYPSPECTSYPLCGLWAEEHLKILFLSYNSKPKWADRTQFPKRDKGLIESVKYLWILYTR